MTMMINDAFFLQVCNYLLQLKITALHTEPLHTWSARTGSKQAATANWETTFALSPVPARHSTLHSFDFSNNSHVNKVHGVIILYYRVMFRMKYLHNPSQEPV